MDASFLPGGTSHRGVRHDSPGSGSRARRPAFLACTPTYLRGDDDRYLHVGVDRAGDHVRASGWEGDRLRVAGVDRQAGGWAEHGGGSLFWGGGGGGGG